ncbi:tRNA (guanine(10)-N2)-methyltransferase [[Candida] jaroonii]|uniref:tRNA (Guanine(10)-N2)-methyltransferase n=1 Tax=[Candida] jaroonii TaxID=467808 RepID=A0ACA9Y5M3_9ASCO|nr:tRNA (guanine(10)-N2)-methyltransferase [[Candida] jaroonii]
MKDYLIYFAQAYPNFRRAELESLAHYHGINIDLSHHSETSPFLIVQLENDEQARKIMERSVLSRGIYELWGQGNTLEELHQSVKDNDNGKFELYNKSSFKFDFIGYMGRRNNKQKFEMIESFQFLAFEGPIRMKNPDEVYTILEEYEVMDREKATTPIKMWFGREIQLSARCNNVLDKYDLKSRKYIGTTSFDAELALVTCNIAEVGPKKIVYDPFTGTGSFLVAASNYGGLTIGSDIDVRILRGKGDVNIKSNFKQYGTTTEFLDILTMDFTNNAFRQDFFIDTIVCDPPYGVREGLKVCGAKNEEKAAGRENVVINGEKAHLRRDFIQPKKPYELSNLLDDLLKFSASRLPVNGRLAFWMPTANDDFEINQIPQHENLELLYNLEQEFNKWSRRLLVYVKRDEDYKGVTKNGLKENNIKNFRDRYFRGFSEKSK